jgi:hypothetical protein
MCKEMLVIPVNKVVDLKRIIGKKWRAEEAERHKGSLTPKRPNLQRNLHVQIIHKERLFFSKISSIFSDQPPSQPQQQQQQQAKPQQQQQPTSLSILDSLLKNYDRRATPTNHLGEALHFFLKI